MADKFKVIFNSEKERVFIVHMDTHDIIFRQ